MAGLQEFKEKLAQDEAFAAEAGECRNLDDVIAFAEEHGYTLTAEEVEELTDVSEEDVAKVAGGTHSVNSFIILVSGNKLYEP